MNGRAFIAIAGRRGASPSWPGERTTVSLSPVGGRSEAELPPEAPTEHLAARKPDLGGDQVEVARTSGKELPCTPKAQAPHERSGLDSGDRSQSSAEAAAAPLPRTSQSRHRQIPRRHASRGLQWRPEERVDDCRYQPRSSQARSSMCIRRAWTKSASQSLAETNPTPCVGAWTSSIRASSVLRKDMGAGRSASSTSTGGSDASRPSESSPPSRSSVEIRPARSSDDDRVDPIRPRTPDCASTSVRRRSPRVHTGASSSTRQLP